jgi:serine protease Do
MQVETGARTTRFTVDAGEESVSPLLWLWQALAHSSIRNASASLLTDWPPRTEGQMKRVFVKTTVKVALALTLVTWQLVMGGVVMAAREVPSSFSGLVKKSAPGVVNIVAQKVIKSSDEVRSPFGSDDPFRDFFDRYFGDRMPREFRQGALGTGFLIDAKGMILTNNHVVEDSTDLKVKLATGKEYKAQIVGKDAKTDVALIQIKADGLLPFLPLGDSDALEVGDWLVAIGNPFGLGNTVTSGIVSSKYRQIGAGAYDNFIQTDASINPGNSGGPLLNMQGQVIGINSAIFSQSGGSVGIGFAIPINMVKELLPQLRLGKVRRSYLGVMLQNITPELKTKLNLTVDEGALVSDIEANGPAANAGIQRGDVIVALDGKGVHSANELAFMVAAIPIGEKTAVDIVRKGKKMTLRAVTEEMKEEKQEPQSMAEGPHLGLMLQAIDPDLARRYNLSRNQGLLVMQVEEGSPAEQAGLNQGDIIIEVDQQSVTDVSELMRLVSRQAKEGTLLLLVDRGGTTIYMTLEVS